MRTYIQRLRDKNMQLCLLFVLAALFAEAGFFFLRLFMGQIDQPVPNYLMWHLVLPSSVNVFLYLLAVLLMEHHMDEDKARNYIPAMTLVALAAAIASFHFYYSMLMTLFLFPIFVSTVYGDRDLCINVVISCLFGETVLLLVRWYVTMRGGEDDWEFLPEAVIVYVILLVSGFAAIFMVERFRNLMDTELREHERQRSTAMNMQMVTTLVNTIEAKDPYTNGHSNRVAMYAREIAARAGKGEDYLQRLYYMSILHDIGKIGIPDKILTKPGELTPEEKAVIQTHPMVGAGILSDITQMPGIVIGAKSHHEHYDGSGYPDGLAGEQIPEEARIIAVADAYDAMTSERSYRSAFSQQKVREEMENGRGTQFDPAFLDIMLDMIDKDQNFAMHGTDADDLLGMVQLRALLGREEEVSGALLTTNAGFEEIYHFLRRYAKRNACEVQLVLITMEVQEGPGSLSREDLMDPLLHDKWMDALSAVVKRSIRQTDVECQLGLSQYMVILTDTNRGNADIALVRIRRAWEELEENPGFRLTFEVQGIIGDGVEML